MEHIHGKLAQIFYHPKPDNFQKLTHIGDVEFFHFFSSCALRFSMPGKLHQGGHMQGRITHSGYMQVIHTFFYYGFETKK